MYGNSELQYKLRYMWIAVEIQRNLIETICKEIENQKIIYGSNVYLLSIWQYWLSYTNIISIHIPLLEHHYGSNSHADSYWLGVYFLHPHGCSPLSLWWGDLPESNWEIEKTEEETEKTSIWTRKPKTYHQEAVNDTNHRLSCTTWNANHIRETTIDG